MRDTLALLGVLLILVIGWLLVDIKSFVTQTVNLHNMVVSHIIQQDFNVIVTHKKPCPTPLPGQEAPKCVEVPDTATP